MLWRRVADRQRRSWVKSKKVPRPTQLAAMPPTRPRRNSSNRNRFLTCLTKGEQMLNSQFNITAIIIINDHDEDLCVSVASLGLPCVRWHRLLRHIARPRGHRNLAWHNNEGRTSTRSRLRVQPERQQEWRWWRVARDADDPTRNNYETISSSTRGNR